MAEATELRRFQEVDLSVTGQDAKGRPAGFDGPPTWACDNPAVDLRVSDDGSSAIAGTADAEIAAVGAAVVTATGDAKQGAETKPLSYAFPIVLLPSDVETILGAVGTARDRVAEPPAEEPAPEPAA